MEKALTSSYLATATTSLQSYNKQEISLKRKDDNFDNYYNKSFETSKNEIKANNENKKQTYERKEQGSSKKDVSKQKIDNRENVKEKTVENVNEKDKKVEVEAEIAILLSSLLNLDIEQVHQFLENNELTMDNIKEFILTELDLQNATQLLSVEGLGNAIKEISALLENISGETDSQNNFQNILSSLEEEMVAEVETKESNNATSEGLENVTMDKLANTENATNVTYSTVIDELPEELVIAEVDETVENVEQLEVSVEGDEAVQAVNTQTENSNDFLNFSNNQSNQDIFNVQAQDVEIKNVAEFSKIANAKMTNFNSQNVIKQIVDNVKVNFDPSYTEIKMQLSPENLGDVTLKVITENGIVTAQFIAENERVKEVIESNFTHLNDTLKEKGIDVSELSVSVGQDDSNNDSLQHFNRERSKSSSRISQIINDINEEEMQEEIEHYVEDNELIQSTISYTV